MTYYSKCKEINLLVHSKVSIGWRYKKGKKHGVIISPSGGMVVIPTTPSDHRAFYNVRSYIRALEH